jgi:hypothetical protein
MTSYQRLRHHITVLETSIKLDWSDLEKADLTHDEMDAVREHIRSAQESLQELAARLDRRLGKPFG